MKLSGDLEHEKLETSKPLPLFALNVKAVLIKALGEAQKNFMIAFHRVTALVEAVHRACCIGNG